MPDDTMPVDPGDPSRGADPGDPAPGPEPGATPPTGTPSVAHPDTGPGATGAADDTSVVAATGAGDETSVPGATGATDETTVLAATGATDATSVPGATGATDETSVLAATGATGATSVLAATGADADADADGVEGTGGGARHARHRSISRTWMIAIIAAVVLLAGAGIALAVSSATKKKAATTQPPKSGAPLITVPPGSPCPLTGVPSAGGVPQRPALAIKVDNYPSARPQSGLDKADVVFEEPVEGGITRLVAVFQCQEASLVGPIRSARAVDVPILDQLSRPLFVHAGGIRPVIDLLGQGNLINDDVFTHASIIQNPAGRYAPYDTYTSTAAAWALDPSDTTPPAPLYTYAASPPVGTPVTSVHIPFSGTNDNTWTWSPFNGQWLLSIGGVPANVADGTRIGVANIVVQSVHVTYGPWLENSEGGLEVQSQLVGNGPLEVFRSGEEISGTWDRAALSDTTSLLAPDGSTIALQPGTTWVELVPSTVAVIATPKTATPGTSALPASSTHKTPVSPSR